MTPVPSRYLGVWQRLSLENVAGLDATSRVYWLQTPLLHADIRIPAERPDFECNRLQELTRSELLELARQQGFAGVTQVTGDTCQWQRHIDYQPPTGSRDIGHMTFEGERIVEEGLESRYREVWQSLPGSTGASIAWRFMEESLAEGRHVPRKGYLLSSGDYFIFARDRDVALPLASSLAVLLDSQKFSHTQLVELLDFELSFGRMHGRMPWEIELSTLPFREGQPVLTEVEAAELIKRGGHWKQRVATPQGIVTRRWSA